MTHPRADGSFEVDPVRLAAALGLPQVLGPGTAPVLANLDGDYGYLGTGYYASLDAELAGRTVLPTTGDALDAYVVPIAMQKAATAGLPVPAFHIVTDRFPPPPLMAYPINPFSTRGELLLDAERIQARRNGLSYAGKYAVLCQELPTDSRIDMVRLVLGRSVVPEYAAFGAALFRVFRVPLMRVRVIVTARAYLLSAIEPLPARELASDELALLEEVGAWHD